MRDSINPIKLNASRHSDSKLPGEPEKNNDIHDYFMNHPDDLPRIKYLRLIEKFLEKILVFNYAEPTEPQIIAIRKWLESKLKNK